MPLRLAFAWVVPHSADAFCDYNDDMISYMRGTTLI